MRVEYAQRMLVGRDVAAKRQVGLVDFAAGVAAGVDAANDGRHGVVRYAVGCVRDDAHGLIGPLAPGKDNLLGGVEQLSAVVRAQAQHRKRPLQHGTADLVKAGHAKLRDLGGMHHGELVRATLEVVVRQNRAAHDGQVGVGANKVVREQVDKVEQTGQRLLRSTCIGRCSELMAMQCSLKYAYGLYWKPQRSPSSLIGITRRFWRAG